MIDPGVRPPLSSRVVSAEVRAELGRRLIRPRAFAVRAGFAYKKALSMLHDQRDWCLEDVEAAADALGVEPMSLLFPPAIGVGTGRPVPWTEGLAPIPIRPWRMALGEVLALDKA